MEIAFHFFNCIRASREQVESIFQLSDKIRLDRNDADIVPDFWITALSCEHSFEVELGFELDKFNQIALSSVNNNFLFPYPNYCVLHTAISCPYPEESEVEPLLQHAKEVWVRNIRKHLLELSLVEEGAKKYLDPDGSAIHEASLVLLENFSETVIFPNSLKSEKLQEIVLEYCGESAESGKNIGNSFITGLSSNCIHGLSDIALYRHLYQIAAVSINYALISYERMWARYVAESLLDKKASFSKITRDRFSDDLLHVNFLIQDASAENYLSNSVEGAVYQRVWQAWGGAAVLKQAESRCNQLSNIFKDHEQDEQDRWESQIKNIAFIVAALGLVTLYTDLFDHLTSGNFKDRLVYLFGFVFLMGLALIYLFRKDK